MKDIIVRITLLIVIAVVVMAWVGWLRFDRTSDRATIEINTQEIERAAGKAVDAGRDLAKDTRESIHEATEPETERAPAHR